MTPPIYKCYDYTKYPKGQGCIRFMDTTCELCDAVNNYSMQSDGRCILMHALLY